MSAQTTLVTVRVDDLVALHEAVDIASTIIEHTRRTGLIDVPAEFAVLSAHDRLRVAITEAIEATDRTPDQNGTAAALVALYDTRRRAAETITLLHLRSVALAVREAHPQAQFFDFYLSDDVPEWHYVTARDADLGEIDGADQLDGDLFDFYLDTADHGVWAALTLDPNAHYDGPAETSVRFDVDAVLTATEGALS